MDVQRLTLIGRRADAVDAQRVALELDELHLLSRARVADFLADVRHACLLITTGSEASGTVA
jgi:hypothetical protein